MGARADKRQCQTHRGERFNYGANRCRAWTCGGGKKNPENSLRRGRACSPGVPAHCRTVFDHRATTTMSALVFRDYQFAGFAARNVFSLRTTRKFGTFGTGRSDTDAVLSGNVCGKRNDRACYYIIIRSRSGLIT